MKQMANDNNRSQEEIFNELKSIATDARSSRPPDLTEHWKNLMNIVNHNSDKKDKFFAHEKKWLHDKILVICQNIEKYEDQDMMRQLAILVVSWFEAHSCFKPNEEFMALGCNSYDVGRFTDFLKTLDYGSLIRCLEEAIADEFSEDVLISLMT